jgi:hypothetical protein
MVVAERDVGKSVDETRPSAHSPFLRDFATVSAGYIAGHGVLRFFAGFLIGLDDKPRAALIERWIPLWNAVGFFLLAWGAYHFFRWLEQRSSIQIPAAVSPFAAPVPMSNVVETPAPASKSIDNVPSEWKAELKALQRRKDVNAMVDLQSTLSKSLPRDRAEQVDRHLGRWYTKHFQRVMLSGRAAEAADDVERVADYYADSEEFGYFRQILPVVRQCAELKLSIKDEGEEE